MIFKKLKAELTEAILDVLQKKIDLELSKIYLYFIEQTKKLDDWCVEENKKNTERNDKYEQHLVDQKKHMDVVERHLENQTKLITIMQRTNERERRVGL